MTIYTNYVFDDKLISPVNGYSCKKISKQNILFFGFETISDLHKLYPDFPLMCNDSRIKVASGSKSPLYIKKLQEQKDAFAKEKIKKIKQEQIEYTINPKKCIKCGLEIEFEKRNWNHCSRKCSNSRTRNEEVKKKISNTLKKNGNKTKKEKFLKSLILVNCFCCRDEIGVSPKRIRNDELYHCDNANCKKSVSKIRFQRAGRKGGLASASKMIKRSKNEIILYDLLSKHFINIDHNKPIANGWDADILLYDHKLAILWNGPWHYKEMGFSNHSLEQVVNRDCIKIQEFEDIGWNVIIYQDNHWTPHEALIDVLLIVGRPTLI